jgi:hypothetical protein
VNTNSNYYAYLGQKFGRLQIAVEPSGNVVLIDTSTENGRTHTLTHVAAFIEELQTAKTMARSQETPIRPVPPLLWMSSAGRYHLGRYCKDNLQPDRAMPVRLFQEEFERAAQHDRLCDCVRPWVRN